MTKTGCVTKRIFGKLLVALLVLCVWASSHVQTASSATTPTFVYWTNSDDGTVGRATTTGTRVNQQFIGSITGGGGGWGRRLDSE